MAEAMQAAQAGQAGWVERIATRQDRRSFAEWSWEGSFEDYLALVRKDLG